MSCCTSRVGQVVEEDIARSMTNTEERVIRRKGKSSDGIAVTTSVVTTRSKRLLCKVADDGPPPLRTNGDKTTGDSEHCWDWIGGIGP